MFSLPVWGCVLLQQTIVSPDCRRVLTENTIFRPSGITPPTPFYTSQPFLFFFATPPLGSEHKVGVLLSTACHQSSFLGVALHLIFTTLFPCYIIDWRSHVSLTLNNSSPQNLSISARTFISFILIFHHFCPKCMTLTGCHAFHFFLS